MLVTLLQEAVRRVREHAVLQTDDDELRSLEASFEQTTDILCVGQVQRSINFVQNVHRRRLELEKSHDKR